MTRDEHVSVTHNDRRGAFDPVARTLDVDRDARVLLLSIVNDRPSIVHCLYVSHGNHGNHNYIYSSGPRIVPLGAPL